MNANETSLLQSLDSAMEQIASLRAENQRLREALEMAQATIERLTPQHGPFSSTAGTQAVIRAALKGGAE